MPKNEAVVSSFIWNLLLEAKDLQKGRAREKIQCSRSVDWQRGKHSVRKIFTLGFCIWRSRDEVLVLRQNKIITWYLVYRRHSRPQRPRSFWSAPRSRDLWPTSGQLRNGKSEIHGLPVTLHMFRVKSDRQIWLVLVSIDCVYKSIQNRNVVGPGQRWRFLVLTKRSAASGDENDNSRKCCIISIYWLKVPVTPKNFFR